MVTPIASRSPSPVQQPTVQPSPVRAHEVRAQPETSPPPAPVTRRSDLPLYARRRQHSLQQLPNVVLKEIFTSVSEDRKQLLSPMLTSRHMHALVQEMAGHEVKAGKLLHQAHSLASARPAELAARLGQILAAMKQPSPRLRGDGLMELLDVLAPRIMQAPARPDADGGVAHDPRPAMLNDLVDCVLDAPRPQERIAGFRRIAAHFASMPPEILAPVLQHAVHQPRLDEMLRKTCMLMHKALMIESQPADDRAPAAQRIFEEARQAPPLQGHERRQLAVHALHCCASLPVADRTALFLDAIELVIVDRHEEDALRGLGEVMRTFGQLPEEVRKASLENAVDRVWQYAQSEPVRARALSSLMSAYHGSHAEIGEDFPVQILARVGQFADTANELEGLRHVMRHAARQLGRDEALDMLSRALDLSLGGDDEDKATARFKSLAPVLAGLPDDVRGDAFTVALDRAWGSGLSESGKAACLRSIMKCVSRRASGHAAFVAHALDEASRLAGDAERLEAIRQVLQHGASLLDERRALTSFSDALDLAFMGKDEATATARFVSVTRVLPGLPRGVRGKAFETALDAAWRVGLSEQGRLACLDALMKYASSAGGSGGRRFIEVALARAGEFSDEHNRLATLAAVLGNSREGMPERRAITAMEDALDLLSRAVPDRDVAERLVRILTPARKLSAGRNDTLFRKAAEVLRSVDDENAAACIGTLLVAARFASDRDAAIEETAGIVRRLTRPGAVLLAAGREGLPARIGGDQGTSMKLARAAAEAIVGVLGDASPAAVEALTGLIGHHRRNEAFWPARRSMSSRGWTTTGSSRRRANTSASA
ncbi:hypothetical protein NCCP691_36970 [Noviherbaspirillum aridicola]|uniref:F-box domain-containing protein n=1 Tax=Noviherbaspirillum aridicola TaxID=2849687 RepID=A0ABQ4Q952_9BURK|nr:hypothetical protein NCCP691_36970 [Noviherbaspirillum aridicola]